MTEKSAVPTATRRRAALAGFIAATMLAGAPAMAQNNVPDQLLMGGWKCESAGGKTQITDHFAFGRQRQFVNRRLVSRKSGPSYVRFQVLTTGRWRTNRGVLELQPIRSRVVTFTASPSLLQSRGRIEKAVRSELGKFRRFRIVEFTGARFGLNDAASLRTVRRYNCKKL